MKALIQVTIVLLFMPSIVFGNEVEVISKVKEVTIYHQGALVNRESTLTLKPGINELSFRNISSKIVLNSLKINNKEITILNKSIVRKLSTEEVNRLYDTKEALTKQLTLIESKFNESGFISQVDELEKMTAYYHERVLSIKSELRKVEENISNAKKLENIKLDNDNAAILKLVISVDGALKSPFGFQYVCGGIGWSPSYEISVDDVNSKKLSVKYLAKAMSQTGEDWDKITIKLSSSFPLESPSKLPKPDGIWTLNGNNSPRNIAEEKNRPDLIAQLEGIEIQEIHLPSFLKLIELNGEYSLKSNSTVFSFPIQNFELPADFFYYGYPGIDPEVYLVAQVYGWDTLGFVEGVANMSFKGNDVGQTFVKFSEFRDTLLLPIGKDNSVYMKRSEIADKKYFSVNFNGKKRQTTLAYQYELKNNNPFPIYFELFEQIPISQSKSSDIDIIEQSGASIDNEIGEVSWKIGLTPNAISNKRLIYTIEVDGKFSMKNLSSPTKTRQAAAYKF